MPSSHFTFRIAFLAAVAAALGCSAEAPTTPSAATTAVSALSVSARAGTDASDRDDRDDDDDRDEQRTPFTFAQIGDMPYGQKKIDSLPGFINFLNADPAVQLVVHTGDIKAGSRSPCTDELFALVKSDFDALATPFIYTPGDNEWTDCHSDIKNNGLFTPTERLAAIRKLFFPVVGQSLGQQKIRTHSQGKSRNPAVSPYVENVWFRKAGVTFGTVNITGSNDDLAPWGTTLPADANLWPSQAAERAQRLPANLAWIRRIFEAGEESRGIVLVIQADMWDPAEPTLIGFDEYVALIGQLAAKFRKPVLLLHGDSHVFRADQPFTATSAFYSLHPNTPIAPNVTRVVNSGSGNVTSYVRITIDPSPTAASLFSWQEVQYK